MARICNDREKYTPRIRWVKTKDLYRAYRKSEFYKRVKRLASSSLFCNGAALPVRDPHDVLGSHQHLTAAHARADRKDVPKVHRFIDVERVRLPGPDGRDAAADVAGQAE